MDAHPPAPTSVDRFVDLTPWVRMRWLFLALPVALEALAQLDTGAVVIEPGWSSRAMLWLLPLAAGASNLWLTRRITRRPEAPETPLFWALLVDALVLTAVLATTGGASNPLSSLYLFPVLLAALLLGARSAWTVLAVTALGYASLFGLHSSHHHGAHGGMSGHFVGMFIAYATIGPVMVYAVLRSREALRIAAERTREARALRDRTERLTALATLAAGASHELASPLSTILVVARELEVSASTDDAVADAQLIRDEVMRCREILHQLSADAGTGLAEVPSQVSISKLLHDAAGASDGITIETDPGVVMVPRRLLTSALKRLVGNAREACDDTPAIHLSADVDDASVTFVVTDRGCGMPSDVLSRATEPFFTTRAAGEGTGLGLFFTESVARHLGGSLQLTSTVGVGTTARLTIPRSGKPGAER